MYLNIGNRREVFWDDYLIDNEQTTAKLTAHRPEKKEVLYDENTLWQKGRCSYPIYIELDGQCLLYYGTGIPCADKKELTKDFNKAKNQLNALCLLKGPDLFHLERPNLGLYEIDGSTDNNILMMQRIDGTFEEEFDNFFVFVDENPDCPYEERVKAIAQNVNHTKIFPGFRELWCYTSPDGIHFKLGWKLSGADDPHAGLFDSMNTVHYDKDAGVYRMFVRGLHLDYGVAAQAQVDGLMTKPMERSLAAEGIRDIRYMESRDFKTWTVPKRLSYNDPYDYQLYTNGIQKYARAPHMYVGFPTRYTERKSWGQNFAQLGGEENVKARKERIAQNPRYGLAVTDGLFMCSRDGLNWNRFHETFIGAEPEYATNWKYGDGYLMHNLTETPCEGPCSGREISFLARERAVYAQDVLRRYSIRQDGFASYHADFSGAVLVTKPFVFEGTELSLNFATSPAGYIYVEILDEYGKPYEAFRSCELFGNTTDRTVYFGASADVSKLAGKPVRLRFTMSSADIYSMIFR